MADVKWIKLATQVFDNRKIKQIERMPDGDSIIVVWFKLLCLAGTANKNGMIYLTEEIPYTEEMLITEFNMEQRASTLRLALRTFEQFGMIEIIDNIFYISSWEKYQNVEGLDKIREQTRKRVAKHRDNQKILECNVTCNDEVTRGNATDIEIEIEIDKDINNKKNTVQEACTMFEKLWDHYPNKKGKGQVSDTKKKVLLKIGEEELIRAIDRYKLHLSANKSWLKPQNGSTFFNSGYLDYLDVNYHKEEESVGAGKSTTKTQSKSLNELAAEAGIE